MEYKYLALLSTSCDCPYINHVRNHCIPVKSCSTFTGSNESTVIIVYYILAGHPGIFSCEFSYKGTYGNTVRLFVTHGGQVTAKTLAVDFFVGNHGSRLNRFSL